MRYRMVSDKTLANGLVPVARRLIRCGIAKQSLLGIVISDTENRTDTETFPVLCWHRNDSCFGDMIASKVLVMPDPENDRYARESEYKSKVEGLRRTERRKVEGNNCGF